MGEVCDDRLTAFKHDYGPVPLVKFATVGAADRSFYCNKTVSGKQLRLAGLLTLGPLEQISGLVDPIWVYHFHFIDNNGLVSNSAFEPGCYLIDVCAKEELIKRANFSWGALFL